MDEIIEQKEERISKIRDMKSELILDAALKVFSQKGIYETRLEDIAAEAGFSKASLYNYYPNKETIILNLATREWDMFFEQLNNSSEYMISETQTFSENLIRYLRLSLKTFGKHFHFIANVKTLQNKENTPNRNGDDKIFLKINELKELGYTNGVLKILNWAKAKNEIKNEFPDTLLCKFIDASIISAIHGWICNKKVGNTEETSEYLSKLLMYGMAK